MSCEYIDHDKNNEEISILCETVDPSLSQFGVKLSNLSELLSRAYVPVEIEFAKQYYQHLAQDKFLSTIAPYFKNGIDKVDWSAASEHVKRILGQFFKEDFPKSLAINKEMTDHYTHILLIAKASQNPVGVLYGLMSKTTACNVIRVPILGISPEAQSKGIGKILVKSLLKYVPQTQKISLSTRITNEKALNAYHRWGFVQMPKTMEHWTSLEYSRP